MNPNRAADNMAIYKGLPGDLKDIKNFQYQNINGKKSKGFYHNLGVGSNSFDINLSGTARQLLGIIFARVGVSLVRVTLTVNNDIILKEVPVETLDTQNDRGAEFFCYMRALSGQDTITISFESPAATPIGYSIIYI